jgi:hypothetical protein
MIQPKLAISTPGDMYEREADRLADQVMLTSESQLQRACACGGGCPACQHKQDTHGNLPTKRLQARPSQEPAVPAIVHEVLASSGKPLDAPTRAFMEPRFGHDFSRVRVHTDARAVQSASAVGARAYASNRHIVFGASQYAPQTDSGRRLLSHELIHVLQQSSENVKQVIQRQKDPKEVVPNKNDPRLTAEEDKGAKGYMPDRDQFKAKLSTLPGKKGKVDLVNNFVNEFFVYYKKLSDPKLNIFQKSLSIKTLASQADTANEIRGIPLTNYTSFSGAKASNADWGKFKPSDSKKKQEGYASMMVLNQIEHREALDLLDVKKNDEAAYKSRLEAKIAKDVTGNAVADLVTSFRKIGDHVNRLYAVYSASQATGMTFNDVMAFYGQESYFTMPSSSGSLSQKIPSPETAGVSVANVAGYYLDFSTMNLTVPQSYAPLAHADITFRKLWALLVYSLQISGSDVAFDQVKGKTTLNDCLDALAAWSFNNRKRSKKDRSMPGSELKGTDADLKAKLKAKWGDTANAIAELSPEHRKAKSTIGARLDLVWVYAPKDPEKMTEFVLTESVFLLKAYQNKPRELFETDVMFDTPLAYMMYNSTWIGGNDYLETLISQAVRDAQKISAAAEVKSGALTDELKQELAVLGSKNDFAAISLWVKERPERWRLLMTFMEKAGQEEWKPEYKGKSKLAAQVNSSNFRTLSEFYKKVINQK